jgi:hypothetical protein
MIVALLVAKVVELQPISLMSTACGPNRMPRGRGALCGVLSGQRRPGRPSTAHMSYSSTGWAVCKLRYQSQTWLGTFWGTSGRKPRQSQGITLNVIPQLVAGSTLRPGSVQQFNPDRGLRRTVTALARRCHDRPTGAGSRADRGRSPRADEGGGEEGSGVRLAGGAGSSVAAWSTPPFRAAR